jgi:tetratricopeptide (TPR) repeat protein
MDLTIEKTFQSAVYAHKAGKLEAAEALYRAILEIQPKHPDANHNLGVLAVLLNKSELALPFFKTAIEANPNQVQFWISYFDSLIKEGQFEMARAMLKQAKTLRIADKVFEDFEKILIPNSIFKESISDTKKLLTTLPFSKKEKSEPSQTEVNTLLEHYQLGRYELAENLAIIITRQYPDNLFSWKVLGAVYKLKGKFQDSLYANQRAVAISPSDAESHNNLGNTFKELGRPHEAEASYKEALAIKPDYIQAHNNLGGTLKELGRLHEAQRSYKKAIALKPDFAEAHNNLGVILQEIGMLNEAEESYKKAIAIKPNYAQAYSNLGVALQELGKLIEAEISFKKAIHLSPELKHVRYNLGILLYELKKYQEAAELLKTENYKNSKSYLLTCFYFMNDQAQFDEQLDSLIKQGNINVLMGSFSCRAEIKFRNKKNNPFCNEPLKYLYEKNLKKEIDFQNIFVKPLTTLLDQNKIPYKKQGQLINGAQTSGNLFSFDTNEITKIKKIIDFEVENYRLHFKNANEGLLKRWPTSYSLYGWLIRMKSDGELRPHIHENGWISGSIYINVPPKVGVNDGNLVVCIDDSEQLNESHKNIINVTTGSLCLFPASLMHYTIPFKSNEDRVVLAFDVVPN